ncbi:MAG: hypothetical protein SFW67_31115 [Myxococcaceae bacterium]|nr:hypothetical protein [Myxococcaceae bacterium]
MKAELRSHEPRDRLGLELTLEDVQSVADVEVAQENVRELVYERGGLVDFADVTPQPDTFPTQRESECSFREWAFFERHAEAGGDPFETREPWRSSPTFRGRRGPRRNEGAIVDDRNQDHHPSCVECEDRSERERESLESTDLLSKLIELNPEC